jgi:asparagine synthase (glutamine-hydrolysing)
MCGIAGILDLSGSGTVPTAIVQAMAAALFHRGPDQDGYLEEPGLALASRRLSIIGLADGRQPIANEDGRLTVVFNGELFDYLETRKLLEVRGHRFATHCDTELIPHLWEEYGEDTFARLRGQFAAAVWDRSNRSLYLGRDRFGICPLYWTRRTIAGADWLLFASEIKALLASGLVQPRPDLLGLDQVFTFFSMPGRRTAFAGIQTLLPGHCLKIRPAGDRPASVQERVYWAMDFPDRGEELRDGADRLVEGLE